MPTLVRSFHRNMGEIQLCYLVPGTLSFLVPPVPECNQGAPGDGC